MVKPVPSAIHESVGNIAIVVCYNIALGISLYHVIMYVHWGTRFTEYICLLGAVTS